MCGRPEILVLNFLISPLSLVQFNISFNDHQFDDGVVVFFSLMHVRSYFDVADE